MSLSTCSACVLAASAGGAVGGYLAVGGRGRFRSRRAVRGSRTMRAWPGGQREDPRPVRREVVRRRGAHRVAERRDDDGGG
jgi:hypothetical protein